MSAESDPPKWFWDLLESSNRSLIQLSRKLEQLPKERLCLYNEVYFEAKASINPIYSEEFAQFISDDFEDLSEDGADDITSWVVSLGREFFTDLQNNPQKFSELRRVFHAVEAGRRPDLCWDQRVDRDEYKGYQSADGIVLPIYRQRFAEGLPAK